MNVLKTANVINTDTGNEEVGLETPVPPSSGWLQLSSFGRQNDQPANNFLLSKQNFQAFNMYDVFKLGIYYVSLPFYSQPINPRNNQLWIKDDGTGIIHKATVPTAYYTYESLITALNGLTWSPVLPAALAFALTSDADGRRLQITNAFKFSFQKVLNLKRDIHDVLGYSTLENNVLQIGSHFSIISLYYTQYVDIVSNELSKFNSLPDESSNNGSPNTIVRAYTNSALGVRNLYDKPLNSTSYGTHSPSFLEFSISNIKWLTWNRRTNLQNIDFSLRDQWGDLLYIEDPVNNPDFQLIFITRSLH